MFAVCLLLLPVVDNIYKESVKVKSAFRNFEALCWQLGDWLDLLSISRGKRSAVLKLKNTNKKKKIWCCSMVPGGLPLCMAVKKNVVWRWRAAEVKQLGREI